MTATYTLAPNVTLFHADCRDALKALPDNCLDSICTDPPYALVSVVRRFGKENSAPAKDYTGDPAHPSATGAYMRASQGFMGKAWDTGETAMSTEFWAQCLRVLKPGGHVAAFGSTRGYHRMACAIEDAGFEIRDSLMWCYGTGFPKSHDVSKGIDKAAGVRGHDSKGFNTAGLGAGYESNGGSKFRSDHPDYVKPTGITPEAREWEGWGTALKPAFEPIVLARKPLSEGTVAANVLRWRTGALNIDASRIPGWKPQVTQGVNSRATLNDVARERQISGDSDEGRWPANVVHDGSDEVVAAFPNMNGSGNARTLKRSAGQRDGDWGMNADAPDEAVLRDAGSGSAARFFYSAKASRADRNGSKHPTVKPVALMQWLARLITPPGGTVLDPFAGSGTTGAACALEGFNVIMCEREAEYVRDIQNRFDPHYTPPSKQAADESTASLQTKQTPATVQISVDSNAAV